MDIKARRCLGGCPPSRHSCQALELSRRIGTEVVVNESRLTHYRRPPPLVAGSAFARPSALIDDVIVDRAGPPVM